MLVLAYVRMGKTGCGLQARLLWIQFHGGSPRKQFLRGKSAASSDRGFPRRSPDDGPLLACFPVDTFACMFLVVGPRAKDEPSPEMSPQQRHLATRLMTTTTCALTATRVLHYNSNDDAKRHFLNKDMNR